MLYPRPSRASPKSAMPWAGACPASRSAGIVARIAVLVGPSWYCPPLIRSCRTGSARWHNRTRASRSKKKAGRSPPFPSHRPVVRDQNAIEIPKSPTIAVSPASRPLTPSSWLMPPLTVAPPPRSYCAGQAVGLVAVAALSKTVGVEDFLVVGADREGVEADRGAEQQRLRSAASTVALAAVDLDPGRAEAELRRRCPSGRPTTARRPAPRWWSRPGRRSARPGRWCRCRSGRTAASRCRTGR